VSVVSGMARCTCLHTRDPIRPGGMNDGGACSPVSAPIPYPPVLPAGVRSP